MKAVSFYHKENGVLASNHLVVSDDGMLEANTPRDHAAIDGHHDHLSKRFDLQTKQLVEWIPPAPSADHVWDEASKTWNLNPDAMAKIERRRTAYARIAVLESSTLRTLREHALGHAGAADKLKEIDDEILSLRSLLR